MRKSFLVYGALLTGLFLFSSYRLALHGDRNKLLMNLLMQNFYSNHFKPREMNDQLSEQVFSLYLKRVDYDKRFFTQEDLKSFDVYKLELDDEIREGTFILYTSVQEKLAKRTQQVQGFYREILATPFDLNAKDSIETDDDKRTFAADDEALRQNWERNLKFEVLYEVAIHLDEQEKADFKGEKKPVEQLESEARAKVLKRYNKLFDRLSRESEVDKLALYLNAIASVYDPHSGYFPPEDKQDFDNSMSGHFEGIGASLNTREGQTVVEEVIPGSASARQGELQAGDVIAKVAQGSEEPVDVLDMDRDEVVRLIRGKKGTEVRLTVKKKDGTFKVIPIIRDIVVLRETFAKSLVLNDKKGKKHSVGYIRLPRFYADFANKDGRRCAEDVAREVEKLKAEGVGGIILDLRSNGGGSLSDVVDMAGLFIEKGPVVQVKSRADRVDVLADRDPRVLYDGPLVIMMNEYAASASEIMAAAIQDYRRGVIVGSTSFGKGTVQRFFELDQQVPLRPATPQDGLGALKLTIQKFYRINGTTTQLKGVVPDIQLPDPWIYSNRIGERVEDFPMEWDEIKPASFRTFSITEENIAEVKRRSQERVTKNPSFAMEESYARRVERDSKETSVPLDLERYRALLRSRNEESEAYRKAQQKIESLKAINPSLDMGAIVADSTLRKINDQWIEGVTKDHYIYEALMVARDLGAVAGSEIAVRDNK